MTMQNEPQTGIRFSTTAGQLLVLCAAIMVLESRLALRLIKVKATTGVTEALGKLLFDHGPFRHRVHFSHLSHRGAGGQAVLPSLR